MPTDTRRATGIKGEEEAARFLARCGYAILDKNVRTRAGEIDLVNASLPPAQRLRKFALLYKEFDADDGELTRTRKVRRGVIAEKYADIIDAIYSGAGEVRIDTEIAFQDGSRQRVRTTLPVASLRGDPPAAAKSA